MNLPTTPGGASSVRELAERRMAWDPDEDTKVDLSVQHLLHPPAYPTLHAIGLGPQLLELERICSEAAQGKHAGGSIHELGVFHHRSRAISHFERGFDGERDPESGARHLVHSAARLLMAAACADEVKP